MIKKKKATALWLLVIMMLFTSCSDMPSVNSVLKDGASGFGDGKEEQDYVLVSSEEVLNHLIDDFSGSHSTPEGAELTEDEAKKVQDDSDEDNTIGTDGSVVVGSRQDLKQAMHQMFDDTKENLEFTCSGNYLPDMDEITDIYLELEREDVYDVICLDQYSYGVYGNTMSLSFQYTMSTDELKSMKEETRKLVKNAVSQIDVTGLGDYEIVCTINDYLCDTVVYPDKEPYAPESHTAYSALKNGSAVCDGYSRAAKLLLNEFGVECDMETGTCTNGGGHAWNLVKVDGNWYQMDVTWNDGGAEWDKNARTAYLLVTDDFMKQSRVWDYSLYPSTPSKAYGEK